MLNNDFDPHTRIPQFVKKQAIDYQVLIKRAVEEESLLETEMWSVVNFYKQEHSFKTNLNESYSGGKRSAVIQDGILIELRLVAFQTS